MHTDFLQDTLQIRTISPPLPPRQVTFVLTCLVLSFVAAAYVFTRSRPVYLLNFHCFKPPAKCVLGLQLCVCV